jgi:hypothetical protein
MPVNLATQEAEIANSSGDPHLRKKKKTTHHTHTHTHTHTHKRADGVGQGVGPEFRPQYHKKIS